MYSQETGKEADRVHNLANLFQELRPTTRDSLDQRFQRIRQRKRIYDDRPKTIEETLAEHKNDFVYWRYFYFFEHQDTRHIELLDLEPAVEAIIEEFLSNLPRQ